MSVTRFVQRENFTTIGEGKTEEIFIDLFSMSGSRETHYPDRTKYVRIQKDVFIVQTVIGKIAKTVSRVRFTSDEKKDTILKKLKNPNQKQSQSEFLKEYSTFVLAAGKMPMWIRYKAFGVLETADLININPDLAEFKTNGRLSFEYEGKKYTIEQDEYITFYDSIQDENETGYSRLKPFRAQVENSLAAQKAIGIQIEKSGVTIVSKKASNAQGNYDDGLDKIIIDIPSPTNLDGTKGKVAKTHGQVLEEKLTARGMKNRIIVSGTGVDSTPLSAGLEDMKYDEIVETSNLSIYDLYSVPTELSPYGKETTYDNKQVAKVTVVEEEAEPLIENLLNSLVSTFPGSGNPKGDFSHLSCMSYVRERTSKSNSADVDMYVKLKGEGWLDDKTAISLLKQKNIIPNE